jgi:hypothetical protein
MPAGEFETACIVRLQSHCLNSAWAVSADQTLMLILTARSSLNHATCVITDELNGISLMTA